MKKCKLVSAFLCLFMFIISISSCGKTKVKLTIADLDVTIGIGETYQIKPIVEKVDNPIYDIKLSDNEILKIDNLTITGLKKGTAKVTVSLKDYPKVDSVNINVTVIEKAPTSIEIDDVVAIIGTTLQLDVKVTPANASKKMIYQILEGEECLEISEDGLITPKSGGYATVLVKSALDNSISKEIEITVRHATPTEIVTKDVIELRVGDHHKIEYQILPEHTSQRATFASGNVNIVSVDPKGEVIATSAGETTILIASGILPEVKKIIKVIVLPPLATSLEVTVPENIKLNDTFKVTTKVLPNNASKEVSITAKDDSGLEIKKDGTIKVLKAGTHTITVTTLDGSDLKEEITFICKGSSKPVFKYNDGYKETEFVNYNKPFDPLKAITAFDADEGDITNKVEVDNPVNNKEYGTYTVKYTVLDADGNEATLERTITVGYNYDVTFIGHGGSYYGIMNTEEAILYGLKNLKYQAIEVDLKQTSDGVFVLCHGNDFAGLDIASTPWSVLQTKTETASRKSGIPGQNGSVTKDSYTSHICTLTRYLELCKQYNAKAVIELKYSQGINNNDQSRMQALMDEVTKAGMLENVILLASQYNCLIWAKEHGYEDVECQYLVGSLDSQTVLDRCIKYNFNVSINVTGSSVSTEEWMAKYHEAGLKISSYTYTQYVDYPVVQSWIDKGVDYVTCDWHLMEKLNLPESSTEPKVKHNVKFVDLDGTLLKETKVEDGKTAAAPMVSEKPGYEFVGWDQDLKNVKEDKIFTAVYKPIKYQITYVSNLETVNKITWESKDAFKNEFYGDFFDWLKSKGNTLSGLTVNGDTYKFTRNGVTVTFKNAQDIMAIDKYDFEKTLSNVIYKPVERASDGTCTILADENYFLNSDKYRAKYQDLDRWIYNAAKTSYSGYDRTYTPTSSGKIQIFFRMQQWFQGTSIAGFNTLPCKYEVSLDPSIKVELPTSPLYYTIEDEIILSPATGNKEFLGWYLTNDYSGEVVTKINGGSTGNITLYAKWA